MTNFGQHLVFKKRLRSKRLGSKKNDSDMAFLNLQKMVNKHNITRWNEFAKHAIKDEAYFIVAINVSTSIIIHVHKGDFI